MFTITTHIIGAQPIASSSSVQKHGLGQVVSAVDPVLGAGDFIYAKGAASVVRGSWVTINLDDGSVNLLAAADIGPVGVAMTTVPAGEFGWYQVSGKAIGKALVGYLDNALVYATATVGSVDDAVVAGSRVKNARGASAVDAPGAGLAEFELNRPFADAGSAA